MDATTTSAAVDANAVDGLANAIAAITAVDVAIVNLFSFAHPAMLDDVDGDDDNDGTDLLISSLLLFDDNDDLEELREWVNEDCVDDEMIDWCFCRGEPITGLLKKDVPPAEGLLYVN